MSMRRPGPCLSFWILGDQLVARHPALAQASGWNAQRALPALFWGEPNDMACLRHLNDAERGCVRAEAERFLQQLPAEPGR